MYFEIPVKTEQSLLQKLRRHRRAQAIKYYPLLVVIFFGVALIVAYGKGHLLGMMIEKNLPPGFSVAKALVVAIAVTFVATAAGIAYFLKQEIEECRCQQYLYCASCNAVDNWDKGVCPVCQAPLRSKRSFFHTTYKDEIVILKKSGLTASKEDSAGPLISSEINSD